MPLGELCRPLYFAQKLADTRYEDPADTTSPVVYDHTASEVGEFYPIYAVREADRLFGPGSVASLMAIQHFCTCPELPLYIAPIDDPTPGTKAVHTIKLIGPATDNGVLSFAILDEQFALGVLVGTIADDLAIGVAGVLQNWKDLPYDVTVAADTVTLTAKNAGMVGNWFVPQWNVNFGDEFPPGVGIETDTPTAGAGIVNINPALPVLHCQFDCVATGFEDENAVNKVIAEIRQNWRCVVQGDFRGGHVFHAKTGSSGFIYAYGMRRNYPEETVIPNKVNYKYPSYLLSASWASRACCTACYDPSRPVQYDNGLLGCLFDSGQCTYIWTQAEKRMFYDAGISNWDIANTRGYRMTALWIEEPLTTWKWNPETGAPDGAWQRMESRYTVTKFVRDLGQFYRANYSSVSLVSDGTAIPPGKRAVSPRLMQAAIVAWFRGTQLGWTAELGPLTWEEMIKVERTNQPNNCDPSRLNVMIDLDLVNQLARIATTIDVSPEFACLPPTATTRRFGYAGVGY